MPLNYKDVIKKLKKSGFVFWKNAKGSHELWKNQKTGKIILLAHHGKFNIPKGTLTQIAKSAGFNNLKAFQNFK